MGYLYGQVMLISLSPLQKGLAGSCVNISQTCLLFPGVGSPVISACVWRALVGSVGTPGHWSEQPERREARPDAEAGLTPGHWTGTKHLPLILLSAPPACI